MEWQGRPLEYDEHGEPLHEPAPAAQPDIPIYRPAEDGATILDRQAAQDWCEMQALKAERAVIAVQVEVAPDVDVYRIRHAALDFASRGAAGAALEHTVITRAQAFAHYLVTGQAPGSTNIGNPLRT